VLAWVELQDEAISTAGDYERFFERDGVRYHHILDPRTLQPARSCQSVTVIAREGDLGRWARYRHLCDGTGAGNGARRTAAGCRGDHCRR
jgi:Membrane-associated lipoprotein involved in thiamine biosynthesis